jgi:two-component system sensor histidine kinase/response regulator
MARPLSARETLRLWVFPPVIPETEPARRRSRTLLFTAVATFAIATLLLGALIVVEPSTIWRRLGSIGVVAILSGIAVIAARNERYVLGGWVLTCGLILLVSIRAWTLDGLYSPVGALLVVLVLMEGVILGRGGSIGIAVTAAIALTVLYAGHQSGAIPVPAAQMAPVAVLLTLLLAIGLGFSLQVAIGNTFRFTLRRAENELAERRAAQRKLGERVKELSLLHHVAQATQRESGTDEAMLRDIVRMIPDAWQHPEVTTARITLDGFATTSPGWRETEWMQSTHFTSGGKTGTIDVAYTEVRPDADEGPFLKEERSLIDSVAEMVVAHLDSMRSRHELEELVTQRTTDLRAASDSLSASLAKLQELEGLRDDLVKMIVHDMRGLLLVVMANLEFAREGVEGQPRADIEDALGAAGAVNKMANTLLDVSRLEEGKMPLTLVPCDLTDLLASAAKALGALDTSRTLFVATSAPLIAACDAELIRRVIDNLVGNAIKHTPSGGTMRLEATRANGLVRVAISDQGPGVPAEASRRIFEKFGSTRKRGENAMHSAGLGLAFCKLAVEAHGGTIGVEPAEPRGSVFAFEIPA